MAYEVFARKYRPRTFEEVLGQDHVVQTLRNAIDQNRLAHAYLFVGPRGTGKTSLARIFAKALNGPGGPKVDFDPSDPVCIEIAEGRNLDVLEIDGASNNGVDQVRDLRDTVKFAPSSGPFRIYYIDEVHMLSTQAFNALLKTLEEPPPHVKFIFATTEPNKILPTILSRCQRFDLRPISSGVIAGQLLHIAKAEGIDLDESAAHAVARGADGGMRDAQSMFDQLVAFCGEKIEEQDVLTVFGFSSHEKVARLADQIIAQDQAGVLTELAAHHDEGRDLGRLLSDLVSWFRALLVAQVNAKAAAGNFPEEAAALLAEQVGKAKNDRFLAALDILAGTEATISRSPDKRLHVEIGLVKATRSFGEASIDKIIEILGGADLSSFDPPAGGDVPSPSVAGVGVEATPAAALAVEAAPADPQPEAVPPSTEEASPEPPAPEAEATVPPPDKLKVPDEPAGFYEDPLVAEALEVLDGKLVDKPGDS